MTFRRVAGVLLLLALVLLVYMAVPYARATSLIIRAANLGGTAQAIATREARHVVTHPPSTVPTRHGDVAAQFYTPDGGFTRTVLLIPGIHSMGIEEPRLRSLAHELAATGVNVVTMALPDLQAYRITPRTTDVIEDAVLWATRQHDLAPDGRIGLIGVSFAGGLSIVAASRPSLRHRLAFVLSFGGYADLSRVVRYLATGEEAHVGAMTVPPPHDYGVAVILYAIADRGIVPHAQAQPLRDGIRTFLLASQQAMVDRALSERTFQQAREYAKTLPEPARALMDDVNARAVKTLGPILVPYLHQMEAESPALSADRDTGVPDAPIYLLHGEEDNVIPAVESVLLARNLRARGADVHLLMSNLVTHASVNHAAATTEAIKLIGFWASVLRR
jgi:dienelactone hydrolase